MTGSGNAGFAARVGAAIAPRFAGLDDADDVLAAARSLLREPDWVARLIAPLIAGLRDDPWFDPALRATCDPLRSALVLADLPQVTLTASITRAAALAQAALPDTVVLSGRRTVTHYLCGGDAVVRHWVLDATGACCREIAPLRLRDGDLIDLDGRREGRLMVRAARDVVAVTATAKVGGDPMLRELAIADGRMVRRAAADDCASRAELLMSFLRARGGVDAAPGFERMSRDREFHLRWAAMREWLMLDARGARPRLAEMAADDADAGVRAAAAATLARLDARLDQVGAASCLG